MADNTLRAWGRNSAGQLGNGTNTRSTAPVVVSGLDHISQVSGGWSHAIALRSTDGTVWTWGLNASGQLGDGTHTNRNVPIPVAGLTGVIAVSGGDCHSAALKSDGTVWTWGCYSKGELGDGTKSPHDTPVQVIGLSHVIAIAARDYHNLALESDGSVWAWGWNINGQLGDNTTIDRNIPVMVVPGEKLVFLPVIFR